MKDHAVPTFQQNLIVSHKGPHAILKVAFETGIAIETLA
jgi:hypothetical protein